MDYYRKNGNAVTVPAPAQTAQPAEKSQLAEKPQQEEKSPKEEKAKKRKKSKIAQELEDAREGRVEAAPADKPAEVNVDSVVAVTPSVADRQQPHLDTVHAEQPPKQSDQKPQLQQTNPEQKPAAKPVSNTQAPVFKVQIMASSYQLKTNDPQLKGVKNVDFYKEGGLFKYTVGASTNYHEIAQLRKTLSDRFPQAFIIAFKNGQKMNVQEAMQEAKKK